MIRQRFRQLRNDQESLLYVACLVLFIPVLFVNLGMLPLVSDEGIRATVALEMDLSGNYFATTLIGEPYFRKPPLFNWIILGFFRLFQSHELYLVRLPSVLALLGFGYTVYRFAQVHFSRKHALLAALLLITSCRIFFNDALLGLIDLTHSWVLFTNFVVIYHFGRKQHWLSLFLASYTLIVLAFLLKGLPAFVAQGCTLLTYLVLTGHIRKLWSWQHITGLALFLGLLSIYFYGYYLESPDHLMAYATNLWDQSEQRNLTNYPWYEALLHIVLYPVKWLYELFPASLLVVVLFRKDVWIQIRKHPFLTLLTGWLITNNLVYWISPFWHARYVFWLFPLLIFIMLHFYVHVKDELAQKLRNQWVNKHTLRWIPVVTLLAISTALIILSFLGILDIDGYFWLAFLLLVFVAVRMFRNSTHRLIQLVLLVIAVRWVVTLGFLPPYSQYIKEHKH